MDVTYPYAWWVEIVMATIPRYDQLPRGQRSETDNDRWGWTSRKYDCASSPSKR